jgi:hypothetical protein
MSRVDRPWAPLLLLLGESSSVARRLEDRRDRR